MSYFLLIRHSKEYLPKNNYFNTKKLPEDETWLFSYNMTSGSARIALYQ